MMLRDVLRQLVDDVARAGGIDRQRFEVCADDGFPIANDSTCLVGPGSSRAVASLTRDESAPRGATRRRTRSTSGAPRRALSGRPR